MAAASQRQVPALGAILLYLADKTRQLIPRFTEESKRLLGILDRRLEGRHWIVDDYSIADIATLGWVNALSDSYAAGEILGLSTYSNIHAWLSRGLARPAVQRGLNFPSRPT